MKDHHAGTLYWPHTLAAVPSYSALEGHAKVKAAIIGGGMSGALCALLFARSGISCCVLERDTVAGASSAANTGLLQFSNDIMLCRLMEQIGKQDAVRFYRACKESVERLAQVAGSLPADTGFRRRSSLYLASTEEDLAGVQEEYKALHEAGFPVDYWSAEDIRSRFPFSGPGAVVTRGDAEVNPFRLVHALAAEAAANGAAVYEGTEVARHATGTDGVHRLETAGGSIVEAEHVVYAVGYEPEELRGKLLKAEINRSFAGVTPVQSSFADWHERMMIWETARPYLYVRTTPEGRVVIGGLDEPTAVPVHDGQERLRRMDKLSRSLASMFPMLDSTLEYGWSAAFGESLDNLPFIGRDPAWRNVYYCLGYGGNGTVHSMLGASILRDFILGFEHPLASLVALDRPGRI
ncbi:NAD(P)/FAD-dependent oxidoreductase [Paenibacillus humicus]|nr:FAD-dependent oxidoreductase [Paenibacillus humicus]